MDEDKALEEFENIISLLDQVQDWFNRNKSEWERLIDKKCMQRKRLTEFEETQIEGFFSVAEGITDLAKRYNSVDYPVGYVNEMLQRRFGEQYKLINLPARPDDHVN